MIEYFKIGQIINVHGIKGELKIYPLTEDIKRFDLLQNVLFKDESNYRKVKIENVKYINKMVVLKLEGIDSIDNAKKYIKQYIYVHRSEAIELKKNTFFIGDIVGIEVYDIKDGAMLGIVKSVMHTGKNDVYEIEKKDGKTFLIPAIDMVVKSIDIENKKMMINLLEGLL